MDSAEGELDRIIALLSDRFPKAFARRADRRKPLKVGIRADIATALGDAVSRSLLDGALGIYTGDVHYLAAQKAGADRIDLDGNPAGVVSEHAARHAQAVLARLKRKAHKRKPDSDSAPKPAPKRDGFGGLKTAARRRKPTA